MQPPLIQTFFEIAEHRSLEANTGQPGIGARRHGAGGVSGAAAAVGALGMMRTQQGETKPGLFTHAY